MSASRVEDLDVDELAAEATRPEPRLGPSQPRYGIVIARDVMVPMRDGIRLATDIYRPAIDGEIVPGRFPTILARTSYDKNTIPMWATSPALARTRSPATLRMNALIRRGMDVR